MITGEKSYEIYREAVGNKAWNGDPLKDFKDLPAKIKNAWKMVHLQLESDEETNQACNLCYRSLDTIILCCNPCNNCNVELCLECADKNIKEGLCSSCK